MENLGEPVDAIQYAAQLGRLDFVSSLMAIVAIALVLGGIFTFIHFRGIAKKQATEISREVAERVANEYLQAELPNVIEAYKPFLSLDETTAEADEIAEAQGITTEENR